MDNHSIQLDGKDQSFECAADDSVLRAGLRAGLGLAYECNVGSCGSCKFQLLEGEVDVHWLEAPGLTKKDWERGRRLACQSSPRSACRIKMIVAPEFVSHVTPKRFFATLAEIADVTHDMREFRFTGPAPAAFLPGQYALLKLPGVPAARAYSMSNVGKGDADWQFVIRRVPNGAATSVLFDELEPGSQIEIDGPYGLAYLRTDRPRDLVCIAGGSGLSPMISIARGLTEEPSLEGRRLHFFYGGRIPKDICGESHLCELSGFGERILYYPCVSMPELDEAGEWKGETGFIHDLVPRTLGTELKNYEYYLAGPPPMVEATLKLLMGTQKIPAQQIHYDRFF